MSPSPLASRVLLAAALLSLACRQGPEAPTPHPEATAAAVTPHDPARAAVAPSFHDVASASGIAFTHVTGAFGRKFLPETMGSGAAFVDYDGDGRDDILLLSGTSFPGQETTAGTFKLYRNTGQGGSLTFEDRTAASGLGIAAYGMGAAAADADNDGDQDILVTCLGPDLFFENLGNGTFRERAAELGLADPGFGSSAGWLDADRDGRLDLIVANYVKWTPETDIHCSLDGKSKSYCTPESYEPERCRFYLNGGGLAFADRSAASGVGVPPAKALGIATLDVDGDGLLDAAVANDTQPNFLFRSRGDGTFEEIGLSAGIAFSESGTARGAMGIDAGDVDGSGRPSLVIGNFSNQMLSLYRNVGGGSFRDVAPSSEVGKASLLTLAFPCFFLDVNLDGALDIFVGNGHVEPEISTVQKEVTYAEPPHLFVNRGQGRMVRAGGEAGADLARPMVARGGAWGDPDGDGDADILVTESGGPARLFQNRLDRPAAALTLRLQGTKSNRDAIGAKVVVTAAGKTRTLTVSGAGSYLSQSTRRVVVGLGDARGAEAVEVTWPTGATEAFGALAGGGAYLLVEGAAKAQPIGP